METTTYAHRVELDAPFDEVVERATHELREQGFGVLTTIDMSAKLKEKIGVDFQRYVILGACNPPLAHRALQAELEIGVLLPCNVIVYESDTGRTVVAAMAPIAAMGPAYQRTAGSRRIAPTSRIGASGYIAIRWNQHNRHGMKSATSEK